MTDLPDGIELSTRARWENVSLRLGYALQKDTIGIRNTLWVPLQISRERIGMLAVFLARTGLAPRQNLDATTLRSTPPIATAFTEQAIADYLADVDAEGEGLV